MKAVTITDARKNLGKWLRAAACGEHIGIISGADVIALREAEVESTDYAWREYGVTPREMAACGQAPMGEHDRRRQSMPRGR